MDEQDVDEVATAPDDGLPDADYQRLTRAGLREDEARRHAEEARRKVDAPPPDTRTAEQKAERVRDFSAGVYLFGATGGIYGPAFDVPTFKAYLDDFTRQAGSPDDAIERMLLQQLAICNHTIGMMHFRAGSTRNPEVSCACLAAAARLMAELRKTTLALEAYREASAKRKARNEKPRNRRSAAPVNGHGRNSATISADSEQGSNGRLKGYFHAEPILS